ncbi:ABC transporter permease subunit [Vibrio tapetis]|uniref:Putative Phosphate transport system permease protein PstC n=1 Tax=Vibrio tapetis subsp. tapetis TaxID=1671868 RepID=A0A2N8ZF24_9VIBR|nr:ABC transporter permease subunit [Vibrio tapetis]SON50490.1 putative Phosphate transport system permease protein PstC [Vibrio tapetis subsp. tapetis]
MSQVEFTLQQRDRVRQMKDSLARYAVTIGGVGVLFALALIFFYLVMMVLPIFSGAKIEQSGGQAVTLASDPYAISVDNYGQHAFIATQNGQIYFLDLVDGTNEVTKGTAPSPQLQFQLPSTPTSFYKMPASSGWLAYADALGRVTALQPEFSVDFSSQGKSVAAKIRHYRSQPILLEPEGKAITQLAVTIDARRAVFAGLNTDHKLFIHTETKTPSNAETKVTTQAFEQPITDVITMQMTPDGRFLYILTSTELLVAKNQQGTFSIREAVDVSLGESRSDAIGMTLLAGAQSLLIQHQDGAVSQWFDVLENKVRQLTFIRDFEFEQPSKLITSDYYRKGFYAFSAEGEITNYQTTSKERSFSQFISTSAPSVVAISSNENVLLSYRDGRIDRFQVDNSHPEVSFSSLWNRVWYEGYPEPQFVWQSTSANDDFEAKLSLVPIAFGTIKAAFFAMVFAVPVAVLAAIYTAYFMSPPMRRVVKPAIEIMEALPTVIIGFLAGLWFAPIVENHLPAIMALLVLLPASTILTAWFWHLMPEQWLSKMPNGWHGIILIPVLILVSWLAIHYSSAIEIAWFGGDMRVFLAEIGIDYDQRNALVVGLAMGFAVIPTIFTISEDAIFSVPKHLSDGSLALGATQWQTLIYVVLLTASPGIFSAIMMGLGRAVGETMIVLMATGNTPVMDWNIFEGMRSLAATIAIEMPESEVASTHYRLLFLAALILFVFTFLVNSVAEWVRQRLRDKYSAL